MWTRVPAAVLASISQSGANPAFSQRAGRCSAADVKTILQQHGFDKASYIISGIPFSTLPATSRERILRDTKDALEPGGAFLVYQFSSRVLADLRRIFGEVERGFQLLNILPAHLFFCTVTGR